MQTIINFVRLLVLALLMFGGPYITTAEDTTKIPQEQPKQVVQLTTKDFVTSYIRTLFWGSDATTSTTIATSTPEKTFDSEIARLAKKYKQSEKLARAIIKCESLQYGLEAKHPNLDKRGNVWSTDFGWWQINDFYHKKEALARGYDFINDEWDNLEYGFILLSEQGRKPWIASLGCTDMLLKRVASTTQSSL